MKLKFLVLISSILVFQEFKAQDRNIVDSLNVKFEEHLQTTTFYKQDQLKVNEEDILKLVDAMPAFGVYRDTYFTTGVPLNQSINRNTADVLFQVSIRQRLTKSRLPFNTFLYLTYTQKSFWDIYAESAPFRDTNYNPAFGLGKYIIHNNILKGSAFLQLEHESNGRDGEDSRSWNMISLSSKFFYNMQLTFGAKVWIPIVDGGENKDLIDYKGIGTFFADYITKDKMWWLTAEITPRKGFANANTVLTAAFKVSNNSNQYLYARFYNGKGDSLLDYNKYEMNIRIGFCIKPQFGSVF